VQMSVQLLLLPVGPWVVEEDQRQAEAQQLLPHIRMDVLRSRLGRIDHLVHGGQIVYANLVYKLYRKDSMHSIQKPYTNSLLHMIQSLLEQDMLHLLDHSSTTDDDASSAQSATCTSHHTHPNCPIRLPHSRQRKAPLQARNLVIVPMTSNQMDATVIQAALDQSPRSTSRVSCCPCLVP